jgi:hypothetical protein
MELEMAPSEPHHRKEEEFTEREKKFMLLALDEVRF